MPGVEIVALEVVDEVETGLAEALRDVLELSAVRRSGQPAQAAAALAGGVAYVQDDIGDRRIVELADRSSGSSSRQAPTAPVPSNGR